MPDLQAIYERYATDVYRFAFWLSGDGADAEDITSETFVRAWVHHEPIRTETLKAYLFTIARNCYLEQRRKDNNTVAFDDACQLADPAPGPDVQAESRLELLRVQRFLQTLPEIDRAAFVLRVQHELPYAEIARTLDLSLAAAKVKVHRVRKRLLATRVDEEVS
jgi:RNA polymerase sigma-70 factor (ECF subfamily)